MTILSILNSQKTHIIYCAIIVVVAGGAFYLFKTHPKEVIKTQTVTQIVTKTVVQTKVVHDNIVTVKHIFTTKPDGTKIVEVVSTKNTSVLDVSKAIAKSDTLVNTKTTDIKYQSNYSLQLLQPFTYHELFTGTPDPRNMEIIGGVRLFGSPVFLNVGTTPLFDKVFIGATIEF